MDGIPKLDIEFMPLDFVRAKITTVANPTDSPWVDLIEIGEKWEGDFVYGWVDSGHLLEPRISASNDIPWKEILPDLVSGKQEMPVTEEHGILSNRADRLQVRWVQSQNYGYEVLTSKRSQMAYLSKRFHIHHDDQETANVLKKYYKENDFYLVEQLVHMLDISVPTLYRYIKKHNMGSVIPWQSIVQYAPFYSVVKRTSRSRPMTVISRTEIPTLKRLIKQKEQAQVAMGISRPSPSVRVVDISTEEFLFISAFQKKLKEYGIEVSKYHLRKYAEMGKLKYTCWRDTKGRWIFTFLFEVVVAIDLIKRKVSESGLADENFPEYLIHYRSQYLNRFIQLLPDSMNVKKLAEMERVLRIHCGIKVRSGHLTRWLAKKKYDYLDKCKLSEYISNYDQDEKLHIEKSLFRQKREVNRIDDLQRAVGTLRRTWDVYLTRECLISLAKSGRIDGIQQQDANEWLFPGKVMPRIAKLWREKKRCREFLKRHERWLAQNR